MQHVAVVRSLDLMLSRFLAGTGSGGVDYYGDGTPPTVRAGVAAVVVVVVH